MAYPSILTHVRNAVVLVDLALTSCKSAGTSAPKPVEHVLYNTLYERKHHTEYCLSSAELVTSKLAGEFKSPKPLTVHVPPL